MDACCANEKYGSYIIAIARNRTIEWSVDGRAEKRHWQRSERESLVCIYYLSIKYTAICHCHCFNRLTDKKEELAAATTTIAFSMYTMRATNDGHERMKKIFANNERLQEENVEMLSESLKGNQKQKQGPMNDDAYHYDLSVFCVCGNCYHLIASLVVILHIKTWIEEANVVVVCRM